MTEQGFSAPVETVRKRKLEATQRLLGDTIGLSDGEWSAPSALPGWSRAHIAAHVSRGADALLLVVAAALRRQPAAAYPDQRERFAAIERDTERSGLAHQIDLDTSAGGLARTLDLVVDWTYPVRLAGREMTLAQIPMARLQEVVLHHIDLDCGFGAADLDPVPARWLLQWHLTYRHPASGPALRVESESGVAQSVGGHGDPIVVTGSDAQLWAWLTGRAADDAVSGANGLRLPLL